MDSGGFLLVAAVFLALLSFGFIALFIFVGERIVKKNREENNPPVAKAEVDLSDQSTEKQKPD